MECKISKWEKNIYPIIFNKTYYRMWDFMSIIFVSLYTNKLAGEDISVHMNLDYVKLVQYILSAIWIIFFIVLYHYLLDLNIDISDRIAKGITEPDYDNEFIRCLGRDICKIRFYLIAFMLSFVLFILFCIGLIII